MRKQFGYISHPSTNVPGENVYELRSINSDGTLHVRMATNIAFTANVATDNFHLSGDAAAAYADEVLDLAESANLLTYSLAVKVIGTDYTSALDESHPTFY